MNVLLVEDNPDDALVVKRMLKRRKEGRYELTHVKTFSAGTEELGKAHYDVILLDMSLPDSNRETCLQRMQEVAGQIPIVVVTGSRSKEVEQASLRSGAQDFLEKGSFAGEALARALRYAVERVQLLNQFREQDANLTSLINGLEEAVLVLTPGGTIQFANRSACQVFGRSLEELEGTEFGFPVTEKGVSVVDLVVPKVQMPRRAELRFVPGQWAGKPACFATLYDIAIRDRKQRELEEAKKDLTSALHELAEQREVGIRQERLEAIGQVVSGIAHQLNNNLTPVLASLDFLLSDKQQLQDLKVLSELLVDARDATQKAIEVVRQLDYFRESRGEGENEAIDLSSFLLERKATMVNRCEALAVRSGKEITLQVVPDEGCWVLANPDELEAVVMALIENSVEAIETQGSLVLSVCLSSGKVALAFADTGRGMTEETRKHCFEPFLTTKGPRRSGLGLAKVYGLVERNRGSIDVSSELNRGTTVTLRFPAHFNAPFAELADTVDVAGRNVLKILIVEEEQATRYLIRRFLSLEGHECMAFAVAGESLAYLEKSAWDVMVLDLGLDGVNCAGFIAQVRTLCPQIKILALASVGDMGRIPHFQRDDVEVVLTKPVNTESLTRTLRDLFSLG